VSDAAANPREPLVTIGIATYNRVRRTFPEALRSALAQAYPRLEIVVCDNASDDGTDAFMADQRDPRLRYHRHASNIGANANFNACLELARGTYFLLLHDDDVLDPSFVERAVAALGGGEPGVALGGVEVIDEDGHVRSRIAAPAADLGPAGLFLAWFDRRHAFYLVSTLFHTRGLREAGGFASPEGLLQDVVAIAQVAGRRGYVPVPGRAGAFRRHQGNRGTAQHARLWLRDAEHLLEVLTDAFPDDADRLQAAGQPYLAAKCYRYVVAVRSPVERWHLYREIHRRFGRSYAPWRFLLRFHRRRLRAQLGAWLRTWLRRPRGRPTATT